MRTHRLFVPMTGLLAACAAGPDFHRPAAPESHGYGSDLVQTNATDKDALRVDASADIPAQWWELFHSRALNELVESALKANPSLAAAQAALRAAQESVYAQEGAYYPSIGTSINPTRQKIPRPLASPAASNSYMYSLTTTQVSVSFVPDIFGVNRRQVESLQAQADAQRYQLIATQLTLTSNLVNAAIQEASLRAQIEATQATIDDQAKTYESFRKQFALGQVAEADVATAQAALAQAQATLPPLQKQLAQQRDAILALAGRFPDAESTTRFDLVGLELPHDLPLTLPGKLVEQRPDVRAAEAQLHSASAQIGVAVANRLPNFSLDANIGSTARLADLFKAGTGFWNVAGTIAQPIFQGGTLLHRQRVAEANYDQTTAQYRSTIISALQNVADTLHAIDADTNAWKAATSAEHATAHALDIARRRMQLGDLRALDMLLAEQTWYAARIALAQAQANRLADSAALFQALGGGWWNRLDAIER